jgi:hypothetical protein
MKHQSITTIILVATVLSFGQTIHLPDYFPLRDGGKWIYRDEFGNRDTATMRLNVPFAGDTAIEYSFSSTEKQYFKADANGLRMLGQTVPLGTFQLVTPIGLAALDATDGDRIDSYSWNVMHVPSGVVLPWGSVDVRLFMINAAIAILDSTYDSVLVITAQFSMGLCHYYLAKNVGIVKAVAHGSPSFLNRELVGTVPASAPVVRRSWGTGGILRKVAVRDGRQREIASLSIPTRNDDLVARVFSADGRMIARSRFRASDAAVLNIAAKCGAGRYVLTVDNGAARVSRVFVLSR